MNHTLIENIHYRLWLYSAFYGTPDEISEFIKNQIINNLTLDYAIKLEDYIEYPNKVHPRINLYYQLYRAKFFLNHSIQNTPYYNSIHPANQQGRDFERVPTFH